MNTVIKALVDEYFELRLFIGARISEIMYEKDKNDYKIAFDNSAVLVCFTDFDLRVDDMWAVQVKNPSRYLDPSDFKRFEELNSTIMRYKTVPLDTL